MMHIAVASRDGEKVAGHIGKCADWVVFEVGVDEGGDEVRELERIHLPKELLFHHHKGDVPHPLAACNAVIGASAGESFVEKMKKRGIKVALTAETDPATAVSDYLKQTLVPPKPRPIGSLICKIHDAFS